MDGRHGRSPNPTRPARRPATALALGILALLTTAVGLGSGAGADTTTTTAPDPAAATSPGAFAEAVFGNEFQGNFAPVWKAIDPTEQSALDQGIWTSCAFQQWVQTIGVQLDSVQVTATRSLPPTAFGPVRVAPTAVTLSVGFKLGTKAQTVTSRIYVTQQGAAYRLLIPTPDLRAERAGNCPSDLGAPPQPPGFAQADMEPGYWFEMTASFPNGKRFTVNPSFPSNPYSSQVADRQATLEYDATPTAPGQPAVVIKASGPIGLPVPTSSLAQAARAVARSTLRSVGTPSTTTLGGEQALTYAGLDPSGTREELIVTRRTGGSEGGIYVFSLTGPPTQFNRSLAAFRTIQRSFAFWPH